MIIFGLQLLMLVLWYVIPFLPLWLVFAPALLWLVWVGFFIMIIVTAGVNSR